MALALDVLLRVFLYRALSLSLIVLVIVPISRGEWMKIIKRMRIVYGKNGVVLTWCMSMSRGMSVEVGL